MSKKQTYSQKLHASREYHKSFQAPNAQHAQYLTEQWREMVVLLGNTVILSKLHTDVSINELFYCSECLTTFQYHYQTF